MSGVRYVLSPSQKPKPTAVTEADLKARRAEVMSKLRALEPYRKEWESLVEKRRELDALIGSA